jgi:hypothetical protein
MVRFAVPGSYLGGESRVTAAALTALRDVADIVVVSLQSQAAAEIRVKAATGAFVGAVGAVVAVSAAIAATGAVVRPRHRVGVCHVLISLVCIGLDMR